MKVFYDLHLHSCLSPCGDNDMTPYNIVNMAKFLGFDMIAVTDHNSCLNCEAAIQAGKDAGILVVPGMELCTDEEAHVVCLFPDLDNAMLFHKYVQEHTIHIKNDPKIFGNQYIMNDKDKILGTEENLLINSAEIGIDSVVDLTAKYGGAAFPAHIDRNTYSVVSVLGAIPEEANFSAIELSCDGDYTTMMHTNPEIIGKMVMQNSDAHYLEHMRDPVAWLDLEEISPECLIEAIQGKTDVMWGPF